MTFMTPRPAHAGLYQFIFYYRIIMKFSTSTKKLLYPVAKKKRDFSQRRQREILMNLYELTDFHFYESQTVRLIHNLFAKPSSRIKSVICFVIDLASNHIFLHSQEYKIVLGHFYYQAYTRSNLIPGLLSSCIDPWSNCKVVELTNDFAYN